MHKYIRHPEKQIVSDEELLKKLQEQLKKIRNVENPDEFFKLVDEIYVSLELIDVEIDPAVHHMVGGYVKEFVTTFLILYFGTKDLEKSLQAHSLIKALTKYIVLLDKHYDEKTYDHKVRADAIFKKVLSNVDGYVKYAIMHCMSSLWATASYELNLRQRMLHGETFTKKEIRNHIFLKSSDTVLYGVILDNAIDSFNPNILQLVHYNQAVLDIQDDLNDLAEDILRHDLNIFVMAASHNMSLDDIYSGKVSPKLVLEKSKELVCEIIDDYQTVIVGTMVPSEYSFLKILSRNYIKTVREDINNY